MNSQFIQASPTNFHLQDHKCKPEQTQLRDKSSHNSVLERYQYYFKTISDSKRRPRINNLEAHVSVLPLGLEPLLSIYSDTVILLKYFHW